MGWTTTHKDHYQKTSDFFKHLFNYDNENGTGKILLCKTFPFQKEVYIAYEIINKPDNKRIVVGIVVLISYHPKSHFNFGYKEIDETSGPGACSCPKSILELLTPTTSEYAIQWRKKCWEFVNRQPLKTGCIIEFEEPLSFNDGTEHKTLFINNAKSGTYTANNKNYIVTKNYSKHKKYTIFDPKKKKNKAKLPLYIGIADKLDKEIAVLMKG